ncbi:hypothetical protein JTE90_023134 [Oedothorax gibbosus]|uniref:Uncharacterized protein n=1 Tax=Oedothorax gibbosus TaxID=931172 RepID=A0AAV6URR3_9ARAC|nr:hypothetical protein JTE90_023134 [Oedothorax gibbosus]
MNGWGGEAKETTNPEKSAAGVGEEKRKKHPSSWDDGGEGSRKAKKMMEGRKSSKMRGRTHTETTRVAVGGRTKGRQQEKK